MNFMKIIVLVLFSLLSSEIDIESNILEKGEVLKAQILKSPVIIENEMKVITNTRLRGCLAIYNVKIERDTEMDGFILGTFGIPVRTTKISCSTGGDFQCPLCVSDEIQVA